MSSAYDGLMSGRRRPWFDLGEERHHSPQRREAFAVTKTTIPNYLRLHAGSKRSRPFTSRAVMDPVARFWQAYTEATGWRVASYGGKRPAATSLDGQQPPQSVRLRPVIDNALMGDLDALSDVPMVSREAAEQLAIAGSDLAQLFQQSLDAFEHQEAELAATATPVAASDTADQVAARLQRVLDRARSATGCDAAAIYMLDEQTTTLKLRACAGLPQARLLRPARPLRGSRGDLESLVRDVVLIDDLCGTLSTTWSSPEPYASAMVVRIEEDELPIGTLWLWSTAPQTFSHRDAAAAQVAAAAVAAELARTKLSRDRHRWTTTSSTLQSAAQWQLRQLPPAMELSPGYFVDGWTESPRPWACSWHSWEILPDGMIAFALAEADCSELCGAMIAATARAAFAAHSNYRHSVTDMLSRLSDSLWQTNSGDQIVSMLYGHLNPENGEGSVASAGRCQAIIAGSRGFRPVCCGMQSDPLASRIDCRLAHTEFRLHAGEALVAVNRGVLDATSGLTQAAWADAVRQAVVKPDCPVLPAIRRALAGRPLDVERAGLMLFRRS